MREVELFRKASATTLTSLGAKEETLSSSLPAFTESMMTMSKQDNSNNEFFFARVTGEGMTASGIFPNDMLVVDQSLEPQPGDIVIGENSGEFILRCYYCKDGREYLLADNTYFKPVEITGRNRYKIWGVVPHGLIDLKRRNNARIHRFEQFLG